MKTKMSRREMVKSISEISVGAGIVTLPFGWSYDKTAVNQTRSQISVKVSPPGPKSLALLDDVGRYIGRSNYSGLYGVGLKDGNGVYIEDLDGNVYIDCLTAASSTVLGYSRDEIARAYYNASLKIQQTCFPYSPNPEAVEFAKKLSGIAPGNFQKKVFMGLSGSDSMCGAIEA